MEPEFWEARYQAGDTRFDLRGPTVPLVDWLDRSSAAAGRANAPGRAFVPGCGRGHDVLELAGRGWDVLGLDFAPSAIHDAREAAALAKLESRARFEQRDFFQLDPAREGTCDLWWENTCYCAIDPVRRDEYASVAARMIRPGGVLLFLVFPADGRAGGPPFAIDPAELTTRFATDFTLTSMKRPPRPSHAARAQAEQLAVLTRK